MAAKQRIILLVGGPMDGIAHELQFRSYIPDCIGLRHPDNMGEPDECDMHWYTIKGGKGYFERTLKGTPRKGDDDGKARDR